MTKIQIFDLITRFRVIMDLNPVITFFFLCWPPAGDGVGRQLVGRCACFCLGVAHATPLFFAIGVGLSVC
jgi:hypothetical protein